MPLLILVQDTHGQEYETFSGTFSSGAGSLVIDPNASGNPAPSWSISIVSNC